MADCPLAEDCPEFSEQISGMGCQHYGDRGGAEWCNHYNQPISDLKSQPVQPGEELTVTVEDIHESGAGVGRTEDGFIILVDGVLPEARARIRVTKVRSNHARAEEVERLPIEGEEEDEEGEDDEDSEQAEDDGPSGRLSSDDDPQLGSRDNFWGA